MIYFLTEERIKDFTTVLGNVDAKLISPLIPAIADQYIKTRTGSHFFNDLLSKYNSQSLNSDEEELVTMIQNSLMWRVAGEIMISSATQITNKGPQEQYGQESVAASVQKTGRSSKLYSDKADFYDKRIVNYIWACHNKNKFPAFRDKLNMDCDMDLYPSKVESYTGIYLF